jgi:hypothetical protein
LTSASEASYSGLGLADRLQSHNLKLMDRNARHRWFIDASGQAQAVDVLEPVFSDMRPNGTRVVETYRASRRAVCNGDGTVSRAHWDGKDWVFVDDGTGEVR